MLRRKVCRLAATGLFPVLLTGCAALSALSLPEERGTPGGEVRLDVIALATGGANDPFNATLISDELAGLPDQARTFCDGTAEITPFVVPPALVVGAFTLAYGAGTSAMIGYVRQKRGRFTKGYAAHVNVPEFHVGTGNSAAKPSIRCIRLRRLLPALDVPASDVVLGLVEEEPGIGAIYIRPLYVRLNSFAASTSPNDDEELVVKLKVAVGIAFVNDQKVSGRAAVDVFEQNVTIPKAVRGAEVDLNDAPSTAYIPLGVGRPATVAVAVTETGNGVETFEGFEDDFRANAKILGDALGNALKEKLAQSGG